MALQFKRGTTSTLAAYTPLAGEPLWATNTNALYIGDGVTAGGILIADDGGILPTATTSTLGGVKIDGTTITIDGGGVISAVADNPFDQELDTTSSVTFANLTVTNFINSGTFQQPHSGLNYNLLIGVAGNDAGLTVPSGSLNTHIGYAAGSAGSLNANNTLIGAYACASGGGSNNTAIGREAFYNVIGGNNIGIGYRAGYDLDENSNNNTIIATNASLSGEFNNLLLIAAGSTERLRGTADGLRVNSQVLHGHKETTGITTTATQTVYSFDPTVYSTAKLVLQIKDSGAYHASEMLLTSDGTDVWSNEYSVITSSGELGTVTATVSGGLVLVQIAPSAPTSMTVKVAATLIAV